MGSCDDLFMYNVSSMSMFNVQPSTMGDGGAYFYADEKIFFVQGKFHFREINFG
jgi:hypothetical protein